MILDPRLRRNLDWPLFALTYGIAIFGVVILFSLTRFDPSVNYRKQMIWLAIGTAGMIGATALDYHVYARFAKQFYIVNIALLLIVMRFAPHVKGAARWIRVAGFQFQPSEFAKLVVILTLTVFLAKRRETIGDWRTLLASFGYIAVPAALIFKQPDLGTALVVLAIWGGMVFVAGAKLKHLAVFAAVGLTLFVGLWHFGVLKEFQKERIRVVLGQNADAKGTGYHVYQARIAIGSGGMWGKGTAAWFAGSRRLYPGKRHRFYFYFHWRTIRVCGERGADRSLCDFAAARNADYRGGGRGLFWQTNRGGSHNHAGVSCHCEYRDEYRGNAGGGRSAAAGFRRRQQYDPYADLHRPAAKRPAASASTAFPVGRSIRH